MQNLTGVTYRVRFHSDKKIKPEDRIFGIKAKLWDWKGMGTYFLVTVPERAGKLIKQRFGHTEKGWGSIPVEVRTRAFTWKTSIFADKKSGSYIMLVKKEARLKNGLKKGSVLSFELTIR